MLIGGDPRFKACVADLLAGVTSYWLQPPGAIAARNGKYLR
jgi:hypothetical protein